MTRVSEDASLDSFAADDSDSEERDDSDAAELSSEEQAVEPATSTYEWSPDGRECEQCGDTVERRWRDDEALVCQACKEW